MARLALAVGGAAIGFATGIPGATQWGWLAGSLLGSLIPQNVRGPSIDEDGAQTTQEGSPRAIVYGTIAVSGNVIDSGKTRKITRKQKQGKGGQSVSTEALLKTFAVRVCEGPIGVVLAAMQDGKIVYDIRPGANFEEDSAKFLAGCRIYLGGEDQLPDPDLEAIHGVGEVPAHRGSAYIVFIDMDVTDRRGSVPQFEFIVAKSFSVVDTGIVEGPNTEAPGGWLNLDSSGNPYCITSHTQTTERDLVNPGESLVITRWDHNWLSQSTYSWTNEGDTPGSPAIRVRAANINGLCIAFDGNFGYLELLNNGYSQGTYAPTPSASEGWYYEEASQSGFPRDGSMVWLTANFMYIGLRVSGGFNWNRVCKFPLSGGTKVQPVETILNVNPDAIVESDFATHLSRSGNLRTLNRQGIKRYNGDLEYQADEEMPALLGTNLPLGFGVDENFGVLVIAEGIDVDLRVRVRTFLLSDLSLLSSHVLDTPATFNCRIVFGPAGSYLQLDTRLYRFGLSASSGDPVLLSDIVSDIHDRCKSDPSEFDVSELNDSVDGLALASAGYSGADAINMLRAPYFFDRSEYDGKIRYVKRGKDVVATINRDGLVDEPDESQRQAQIEYPKKLHLTFQSPEVNYSTAQSTSERSSPDIRVVGEASMQVPVAMSPSVAAKIASKLHKVSWTEAEGEVTFSIPDSYIRLVPSDCIALEVRGSSRRLRIDGIEHADGVLNLTTHVDRQSAYVSNVGYIPLPVPTPPVTSVAGQSVLAVMDLPALRDADDSLVLYGTVTGASAGWRGALLQRSFDSGANYVDVIDMPLGATMGFLEDPLPAASPWYTDGTNSILVRLIREDDELVGISEQLFLSRGGAIAIGVPGGSWEIIQFREATNLGGRLFRLHTLHRGQLNTPATEHASGEMLVLLDESYSISAQSAWIQQDLTHRAASYGETLESASPQTMTYRAVSQIEWPVSYLSASIDGTILSASWAARHRFGSDANPVASVNFQGFRITVEDGVTQLTNETTAENILVDVSALSLPITVTVAALNRITGVGPEVTKVITA